METTKVVLAQTKSRSLRTTIPASIARLLGISDGSELGWEVQPKESKFVLVVHVLPTGERIGVPMPKPRKKRGHA